MAYTQADLDALKAAYISTSKEVQIGDQKVVYKTQKEILEAIRLVEKELSGAPTTSPNVITPTFSKGQS